MAVVRQLFEIDTALDTGTGPQTLQGTHFMGGIAQIGWNPETADTGDNLDVILCPIAGDTSGGFPILNKEGLGSAFLRPLMAGAWHKNGSDTGVNGAQAVYASAGDHLVVRATPSGAALKGKFYAWHYEG